MANEKIVHLSDGDFDSGIREGLTLVDFWAEWCAPCKALAPIMDELADAYGDKLKVAKVNIDANPDTPSRFGIRGIPTVILFRDGEKEDMFVGNSPQAIKDMVARAV